MTKLTLEQKRLQKIKQQLFGKEDRVITPKIQSAPQIIKDIKISPVSSGGSIISQDANYLKRDLAKIGILTSAAIMIQFLLYFLIQRNLINLNFSLF